MVEKPQNGYSNEEFIDGIVKGDLVIIKYIRSASLSFLLQRTDNRVNKRELEEIIQDALVIVYRKLTDGKLTLSVRFLTYFLAVCKKIQMFETERGNPVFQVKNQLKEIPEIDDRELEDLYLLSKEFNLYRSHFNQLKKKHQRLIEASLNGFSYEELFRQFGYSSVRSFKNAVCRVRKKLVKRISSDPLYEVLKEKSKWSV